MAAMPAYLPSWNKFVATVQNSPVDLRQFETFLQGINHYAREGYDAAGTSELDKRSAERSLLVTGVIPEQLDGLAGRLVTNNVDRLIDDGNVDPMTLFEMDVSSLGLTDDLPTQQWWEGRRRCSLRKVDMAPNVTRWRQCARCGRLTEDLTDARTTPPWMHKLHRTCMCGSSWVIMER